LTENEHHKQRKSGWNQLSIPNATCFAGQSSQKTRLEISGISFRFFCGVKFWAELFIQKQKKI
jgi:hypothetical protein